VLLGESSGRFLNAGANVKAIKQVINSMSATSYGADAGVLCVVMKNVTIGVSVQNIVAPRIKLLEATDEYPLSVTAGGSCRLFNNNLLIAVDANKTYDRDYKLRTGGEYCLFKTFFLRAGINDMELDCGFGFRHRDYSIDYAFGLNDSWKGHDDLGNTHRIGITIKL